MPVCKKKYPHASQPCSCSGEDSETGEPQLSTVQSAQLMLHAQQEKWDKVLLYVMKLKRLISAETQDFIEELDKEYKSKSDTPAFKFEDIGRRPVSSFQPHEHDDASVASSEGSRASVATPRTRIRSLESKVRELEAQMMKTQLEKCAGPQASHLENQASGNLPSFPSGFGRIPVIPGRTQKQPRRLAWAQSSDNESRGPLATPTRRNAVVHSVENLKRGPAMSPTWSPGSPLPFRPMSPKPPATSGTQPSSFVLNDCGVAGCLNPACKAPRFAYEAKIANTSTHSGDPPLPPTSISPDKCNDLSSRCPPAPGVVFKERGSWVTPQEGGDEEPGELENGRKVGLGGLVTPDDTPRKS